MIVVVQRNYFPTEVFSWLLSLSLLRSLTKNEPPRFSESHLELFLCGAACGAIRYRTRRSGARFVTASKTWTSLSDPAPSPNNPTKNPALAATGFKENRHVDCTATALTRQSSRKKSYKTRSTKRDRRSKIEVEILCKAMYDLCQAEHPEVDPFV